jgi:hypothetical protein
MELIQLDNDPQDGIAYNDRLCFGIRVKLSEEEIIDGQPDALYKFRENSNSNQNDGRGWYCNHTPIQFKLELRYV